MLEWWAFSFTDQPSKDIPKLPHISTFSPQSPFCVFMCGACMHICVFVCVWVRVCMQMCVHVYEVQNVFTHHSLAYKLRQSFSFEPCWLIYPGQPFAPEKPFVSQIRGIQVGCHTHPALTWLSRSELRFSCWNYKPFTHWAISWLLHFLCTWSLDQQEISCRGNGFFLCLRAPIAHQLPQMLPMT